MSERAPDFLSANQLTESRFKDLYSGYIYWAEFSPACYDIYNLSASGILLQELCDAVPGGLFKLAGLNSVQHWIVLLKTSSFELFVKHILNKAPISGATYSWTYLHCYQLAEVDPRGGHPVHSYGYIESPEKRLKLLMSGIRVINEAKTS